MFLVTSSPRSRPPSESPWLLWLDIAAIAAWGVLMLKYWLTGKLRVLIHPAYAWLCVVAGVGFLIVSIWKALQVRSRRRLSESQQHVSLFPPGWSTGLLLLAACIGLVVTPRPFTSQVALDRGVTDFLGVARIEPQSFRGVTNPEDRTIIDWSRTLSVYPEPDAYAGDPVDVIGFVILPEELSADKLIVARFTITCCAADAYPIGIPVVLPEGEARSQFESDSWIRVRGEMISTTLAERRQVAIAAREIEFVPEPDNPYDY